MYSSKFGEPKMNFSEFCSTIIEPNVKLEPLSGFCQCCLSENNLKSMLRNTTVGGKIENYSEMLEICFSIQVMHNKDYPENSYLICDTCIVKLRESCSFRCQVQNIQSKLKTAMEAGMQSFSGNEDTVNKDIDLIDESHSDGDTKSDVMVSVAKENTSNNNINQSKRTKGSKKLKGSGKVASKLISRKKRAKRSKEKLPLKLDKNALNCYICHESFPTHHNLCSHMAEHFPNHICELCGKSFIKKGNLIAHMKTHEEERIPCKYCGKMIKKPGMSRHILMHTGENNLYPCLLCSERFVSFSIRVTHMAEVHGVIANKYKCKICFKNFRLASNLSTHVRSFHMKEINHTCSECGKGFFGKSTLTLHMLKHTKEKNFKCEICLKPFGRKYSLGEHMKIHSNIRQHVCHLCDKSFSQKCSLKVHLRKHIEHDPTVLLCE